MEYLSLKGLKKAVLHCAKHPGYDVVGAISEIDSFPMFHSRLTTAITEVAMRLLKDQQIIGFYESKIRPANTPLEPSKLVLSLAQALKSHGVSQILILCIDNDWEGSNVLSLFTLTNTSFTKIHEYPQATITQLKDFLLENPQISDFDDHFANPLSDWKNLHIN